MNRFILFLFCVALILTGCSQDKPRPEGGVNIIPLQVVDKQNPTVEVISQRQKRELTVSHHVRGQNVYVECYVPSFTFRDRAVGKINGEGHVRVSIDGERMDDIYTAAFIVKGLEKGHHQILVEVVHNDSTSYDMKKSWNVLIK